jgi:hypothetical protein
MLASNSSSTRCRASILLALRSALPMISPRCVGERSREIAQRAGRAEHRGKWRLEIVRDRGQQRRAQPVGLDRAFRPFDVLDQVDALDRERTLVDQGIEQTSLVGGEQRSGLVAVDADDAD